MAPMLKGSSGMRERAVAFYESHPLFVVAMVTVTCVALVDQQIAWGIAAAVFLGFIGFSLKGWQHGLAWLICGGLALGGYVGRNEFRKSAERMLIGSAGGEMQGKVLADGKGSRYWAAPVVLQSGPQAGAKVWWEGRGEVPVAGAVVKGRGNFAPLPLPRNPGEFDQASWLRSQGIAAVFEATLANSSVTTDPIARWGARIRQGFRAAVTAGLEEESQQARVIRAIVIGEQPENSDVLVAAFRNSGTLHAFSVSGLHVAMVGSIAWLILRLMGVPRRWAVLALLPLIFGYSWLTGNSAPAVRSAWMASVFLGAFIFRRRPDLLNALGAVLLAAMLFDGRLLFQPGVQLSYGVVAAISVGTAWTSPAFSWLAKPELYLPLALMTPWQTRWLNFRRNLAQSLGVSLAAGIGSTPLTAFHFGLVTPVSIFAGIVLVPLVFVLLCAALLAVAIFPVSLPVSCWVNKVNAKVADACVLTAQGFSSIPGGHFQIRQNTQPFLLIYDLEHGAGAACFSGVTEGAVLLDCGDFYSFKRRIVPSLRRLGITPDSVVLSHPDGDHLGGGAPVWEAFPIKQVLLPVERSRSPGFRSWMNGAPRAGIQTLQAAKIPSLPMPDGARLEILHVPDPLAQSATADERVTIFRLHWRGWKILITTDAGVAAELALLDAHKDISADLIITGHHRGDLTLTDPFLDAVHPQAILASNSPFPISERLDPNRVTYWRSRGIQVIDQAKSGGVTLTIDPSGALRLEGFADHSILILKAR
ncbi:MAG: ComEC/Rec2 family competence protein [Luteolibacter sp.]